MKKLIQLSALALCVAFGATAQVKIGYNAATNLNNAAVLQLSNDTSAASTNWKGLLLPYVNFTSTAPFTDSSVWGIAGTATSGTLVYNVGNRNTNGFRGIGVYVWRDTAWSALSLAAAGNTSSSNNNCVDPSPVPGATGCVAFTYRGQQVYYPTVRAKDGKIWLQQSLGASKVADSLKDTLSYGDYFQWGRWDDGHQYHYSTTGSASNTLSSNDPSGLPATGSNLFFTDNNPPGWWNGSVPTDTWSGTNITTHNGKDPCTALGAGWHVPDSSTWKNVISKEGMTSAAKALGSSLKLSLCGYRNSADGAMAFVNSFGAYWTTSNDNTQTVKDKAMYVLMIAAPSLIVSIDRGYGMPVRCVK